MNNLVNRLLSAALLVGVVLGTLFWFPVWVYVVVVMSFVAVALYEFFTMVRHRGILVHRPLSVILGLIYTSLVAWRSLVEPGLVPLVIPPLCVTLLSWMWDIFWPATIVIIFIRQFTRENTFEALGGLATTLFGLAYIAFLFSYLFYIRARPHGQGALLVLFLILVTKMADVGAYAIGNVLGRHTLMPRISPRKTVEGLIGAMLFGSVSGWFAQPLIGTHAIFGQTATPILCLVAGMILGVIGQLGDLAESLLKRDCQVKDTGTYFPGLGGVLDVIDSLLFTAPIFYGILIYG